MKTQNAAVVVTGSAAQVAPEIASQLGIVTLPLTIIVAGKAYLDGVDIFPGELYQEMRSQKVGSESKAAADQSNRKAQSNPPANIFGP